MSPCPVSATVFPVYFISLDLDEHQNQLLISREDILAIFQGLKNSEETVPYTKFSSFICEAEGLLYNHYEEENRQDNEEEYKL